MLCEEESEEEEGRHPPADEVVVRLELLGRRPARDDLLVQREGDGDGPQHRRVLKEEEEERLHEAPDLRRAVVGRGDARVAPERSLLYKRHDVAQCREKVGEARGTR